MTAQATSITTRLLHADEGLADPCSMAPPLHQSVNHSARDADHLAEIATTMGDSYYTRRGNPTSSRLARVIADLEGAETGLVFASGMGAIATTIMALVRAGDHIVGQRSHYIGITKMLADLMPGYGVETTRVDQRDPAAFAAAIRPNTRLIVLESPVNPTMHLTDFQAVSEIARARGIPTACDSTFATPINQRPIAQGVDIVMHSVTKYIGGHHDLLAGCVVSSRAVMERIWDLSMTTGAIGAPFNSWLALRGIRTMELRVRQQNATALAVAHLLERHPAVARVYYPGLDSHPQHDLARRQMSGFGGLLTFDLKGGYQAGIDLISRMKLARNASSLGGVSTVVTQPAVLFAERLSPETLAEQGLTPGLIRLAVGIEATEDLLDDLDQALRPR